jgi:ABC-type taurine transport system ATPase subunit
LPHTIPVEQKKQYARSLLSILGLERQADMVIGNNMQDGISADQRKRVTMGVEMAADPAILFLDEVCCLYVAYVAFLIQASNIPHPPFLELRSRRRVWTRLAPSA